MQIEIYNPTQGNTLPPVEWNYAAVKKWIEDGLEAYKGRVYTEETVTMAKKDRATLNKLAEAIDGKRKEMKAMYLRPYEEFEAQAKELTAMVKAEAAQIDAQVKAFDDSRKQEKMERIKTELYTPMIDKLAELVPYERLHDPKWLNVTVSMAAIGTEMAGKIERISSGLASIDTLNLAPDIAEQVKGVFLKNFDLAAALDERRRIEKQREELARYEAAQKATAVEPEYTPAKPTEPVTERHIEDTAEEPIHTVVFRIHVTPSKLKLLGDFMKANGIRPERV